MKFLIKVQNSSFNISRLLANTLDNSKNGFSSTIQNKTKVFILNDSHISLFQAVKTTSLTHFYVEVFGKKCRISKDLFGFLVLHSSKNKNLNLETGFNANLDKFYTKSSIAELCVSTFVSNIIVQKHDLIIEPSAGNGSFIKSLKEIKCNKIFIDIAPESNQIDLANFLEWSPPIVSSKIHVVGNPPFGKQSSLCHKFIKHASTFADSISFILPLSFKKLSNMKKMPARFHLVKEVILPLNSFTQQGTCRKKIPTVFQVWEKKNNDRFFSVKNPQPSNFSFVSQSEANVAITRVGSRAGMIRLSSQCSLLNLTKSTHYFLKVDNDFLKPLDLVRELSLESSNWVCGAKSLSKLELINFFNML